MKNPYRVAAVSSILSVVLMIILFIVMIIWVALYKNIYLIYIVLPIVTVLIILFYSGIVQLGKQYSSGLIAIGAQIRIVFSIIAVISFLGLVAYYQQTINNFIKTTSDAYVSSLKDYQYDPQVSASALPHVSSDFESSEDLQTDLQNIKSDEDIDLMMNMMKPIRPYIIIFMIVGIIFGVLPDLLISFGFLKVDDDKVKYSKVTGVLGLIYGFGMIIQLIITSLAFYGILHASFVIAIWLGLANNILGFATSISSLVWYVFILVVLFSEAKKLDAKHAH